ncbi:MAG: metalloregulator ArsR/SmtB family transcription factor [Acidobacteriota bacterium]
MSTRPDILDRAADLAELTRCRLLLLLDRHELAVSELCTVLQLPQSTVSRHLKVLADGGWVTSRRDGTSNVYRRSHEPLQEVESLWRLIRSQVVDDPETQQDRHRLAGVLRRRRSRSEAFFSATADDWDRLRDELFGQSFDLEALVGLLDPSWTVGDLGCGTGRVSAALASWVHQVIAVDGSSAMLEAARERLRPWDHVDVRGGDLEHLPLEDATLDAATLFLALHHTPDPAEVLREARRVLKPGGRLLVVDMLPHGREEYRQNMGHVWLGFSESQLARATAAAGFVGLRFRPLQPTPDAKGPALFAAAVVAGTVSEPTPEARSPEPVAAGA